MTEIESAMLDLIDDSVHHVTGDQTQIKFTTQYVYITDKWGTACVNRKAFVNTVMQLNAKMEDGKLGDPIYIIKQGIHTTYLKPPICPVCARAPFKPFPIESENKTMLVCGSCNYKETYDTWSPNKKGCDTCD